MLDPSLLSLLSLLLSLLLHDVGWRVERACGAWRVFAKRHGTDAGARAPWPLRW